MQRRSLDVNGITLSFLEAGEGPAVVLCHGFPETAYAWRHQISALAAAGYHAVAPDMRGYGASSRPEAVDEYTVFHTVGDVIALLDALGVDSAVVVGGDWGATTAWQAAALRPDRIRGVVALGVPLMARAPMQPTQLFPRTDDALFYTLYFQAPGVAERDLEHDVQAALRKIYVGASGDAPADAPNPFGMVPRAQGMLANLPDPKQLPGWLTRHDLDVFADAFIASGFSGGLNYYRNLDRNWRLQAGVDGLHVTVPALFIAGERDPGLKIPGMDAIIAAMPQLAPDLRAALFIQGAGHWLQQERPREVNDAILSFLRGLTAVRNG